MADYNLGTASGRIVIDGSGAEVGFAVARSAAGAFFDVVQARVDQIQNVGKTMAAVGTAGVAGLGVAVKVASSFQEQMSGVQAVTGSAGDEFESLRQLALQLGADTTFSASEAALAIEELAKAGIPVEDILSGAAEGAVALAAAGGVSLPEAATVASNAMNQFGLAAEDVVDVADTLAGVANTSASDVSGLGQSLSQVGAVANLAGLSFDDTAIAIGQLADAGINGSDAGTSLKTMLNNLIPSTEAQSAEFKKLGLLTYDLGEANKFLAENGLATAETMDGAKASLAEFAEELGKGRVGTQKNTKAVDDMLREFGALDNAFFDAQGNIRNLGEVQGVLNDATKDMTKEQKLASLEILFGADAMRASAILSENGAEGYNKFAEAVGKTSAADVAKTRLDNLGGSVEEMSGAFETAMITIGNVFLPVVRAVVDGITSMINIFNELPAGVQKAIAIFALIASSGLIVLGLFLALLPVIAGMVANFLLFRGLMIVFTFFKTLVGAARAGTLSLVTFRGAAVAAGTSARTLGLRTLFAGRLMLAFGKMARAAWILATGPIGILVAAVAAMVAIGYVLYQRWAPFRELMNQIGAAIRDKFLAAWAAAQPYIERAKEMLQEFGDFCAQSLMPTLREVGDLFVTYFVDAFNQIVSAIQTYLLPAVAKLVDSFNNEIAPAMESAWEKMAPVIAGFLRFAAVVGKYVVVALAAMAAIFIKYVLPVLIKVGAFLSGVLIDTIVLFVEGLIQAVSGVIEIFSGLINFISGVFKGDWGKAWEGIKQIFHGILNLIVGLVKMFISVSILKAFRLGFSLLKGAVTAGWGLIRAIFTRTFGFLRGIITGIWGWIRGIFSGGMTAILNFVRTGFGAMVTAIATVLAAIVNFVVQNWTAIQTFIGSAITTIKNLIEAGFNAAKDRIFGIIGAIGAGISTAWGVVTSAIGGAISSMVSGAIEIATELFDWFMALPGEIKSFFTSLPGDMLQIGIDIVQGLINGLLSMFDELGGTIGDLAGSIAGGVGDFLGIASPSKLMIEYGQYTVEGLEVGVDDRTAKLAAVARTAAVEMSKAWMNNLNMVDPMVLSAMSINGATAALSVPAPASSQYGAAAEDKKYRMIEGKLLIDENSQAWVRGIAEEVVDDDGSTKDRFDRMYK